MSKIVLILAFIAFVVVIGPIATIWSLNTLFPSLAIPMTLDTWMAVFVLGTVIRGDGLSFKAKS
jgi:hypothetical protein